MHDLISKDVNKTKFHQRKILRFFDIARTHNESLLGLKLLWQAVSVHFPIAQANAHRAHLGFQFGLAEIFVDLELLEHGLDLGQNVLVRRRRASGLLLVFIAVAALTDSLFCAWHFSCAVRVCVLAFVP